MPGSTTSDTRTRGIRVQVRSQYVPERSDPDEDKYFFAYHIRIRNEGEQTVQLVNRAWTITDGRGEVQEVRGPGVVGEQPVLEPGEEFEYTSACPLDTPLGTMEGRYEMVVPDGGERFDVRIGLFSLQNPQALN
jgi:ApaG protein